MRIHCTSSKTKKSLEKKKATFSTILTSKPLSAYTESSSIHNRYARSAQAYGFLTEDSKHSYLYTPIYTHIHQYKYTHSDITTVIYPQ